jgi:hypothetical protein
LSRDKIVIPPDTLWEICTQTSMFISANCPENQWEEMLDSHIHFLMSDELRPLFTPPEDSPKYLTLKKKYDKTRVHCVYSYLYELCNWGQGIKPKITEWVKALVKEKFFEAKAYDQINLRWKQLK